MSHFEYVSVAIALMNALAIGRLLAGLSSSLAADKQYWVHTTWISTLLLIAVMSWWAMWALNEVAWTPIRFLWALSIPALLYVRASVLLGHSGDEPDSYYEHFYAKRPLFFSLGLVTAAFIALTPWVQGIFPWLEIAPIHISAATVASISLLGLLFRSPTVHAVLAVLAFIGAASGFIVIRVVV
ncbi:MAG: hypothetical protein ABJ084_00955 [Halioglobus sp.]